MSYANTRITLLGMSHVTGFIYHTWAVLSSAKPRLP